MALGLAGGTQKRPRGASVKPPTVALADCAVKHDDNPMVRACFEYQFNAPAFLEGLRVDPDHSKITNYLKLLEDQRGLSVETTVNMLPPFKVLKD